MATDLNRRFLLASRPEGLPQPENFRMVEEAIPTPGANQILVQNLYLSVDPAIRGWLDDKESYFPPIPLGGVIKSMTVGKVIQSNNPDFAVGDHVSGLAAWEDYSVLGDATMLTRLPDDLDVPLSYFLTVLSPTGITAHVGVNEIAKAQAGETFVISAAAGAVGAIAGQIAKIRGCRVIGIAGSDEKCRWLRETLGFDGAVNYRTTKDLGAEIKALCPGGVDIYFDNVGGEILDAMLPQMKLHGRIAVCGMIADYNAGDAPYGVRNLWQLVVKRLNMRGFLTPDHGECFAGAYQDLARWVREGRLIVAEDLTTGFENTPRAFLRLFKGENIGKAIVQIA